MNREIFWFFLVLWCHQTIAEKSANNLIALETKDGCSSSNLNDRVSKLEAKDHQKEVEISALKATVNQLRGQIERLEAAAEDPATDDVITGQVKRPVRLLPFKFLRYLRFPIRNKIGHILYYILL